MSKLRAGMVALGLCVFVAGCGAKKEPTKNAVTGNIIEEESVPNEATDSITEDEDHEKESGFSLSDLGKASDFIDYEFIQENHEILEYDICTLPRYDYDDTILAEYLRDDKEEDERAVREFGLLATIKIDYFTYDLNEDGLEDYLVCIDGYLWSGAEEIHFVSMCRRTREI